MVVLNSANRVAIQMQPSGDRNATRLYIKKINLEKMSNSEILAGYKNAISILKQTIDRITNDEIRYNTNFRVFSKTVFDEIYVELLQEMDDEYQTLKFNEALNSKSLISEIKKGNTRGNKRGLLNSETKKSENKIESTWNQTDHPRPEKMLDIYPNEKDCSNFYNFRKKWGKVSTEINFYISKYF